MHFRRIIFLTFFTVERGTLEKVSRKVWAFGVGFCHKKAKQQSTQLCHRCLKLQRTVVIFEISISCYSLLTASGIEQCERLITATYLSDSGVGPVVT